MRNILRLFWIVCAVSVGIVPSVRGTARIEPAPQVGPVCYSIVQLPCADCPGRRSKFCSPDPAGLFQSCVQSISDCSEFLHCSQVTTTSGPACD